MFEGELQGTETNRTSQRPYSFAAHYLGDSVIMWRAVILTQTQEFCGELRGEMPRLSDGPDEVRVLVDALIRVAIRDGVGYRTL